MHTVSSSQGQVDDLPLPLCFAAAFGEQEDLLNGASHRQAPRHLDYAGHGQSSTGAFIGILGDRCDVVRHEQATGTGCPGEDHRIIDPRQARVLNPHNVDLGKPATNPCDDIGVEVLVCEECKHQS
jgi:hypothetical protein